ncbi:uncharacterized protein LOC144286243 [Canis aureus]
MARRRAERGGGAGARGAAGTGGGCCSPARPLARSPARRSALLPPPPRPRAPTSSGPRAELPRALSGPAEGMPAGTSGSRRRCAAKKGEARRRGCAPWSSGTRHLGTPAASSRHLRAAGARSPGLASGGKCGEWGEGLRTPHRGLLGVHQPGSDDPHPRDLVCVLGLLPSTWQSGRIPGSHNTKTTSWLDPRLAKKAKPPEECKENGNCRISHLCHLCWFYVTPGLTFHHLLRTFCLQYVSLRTLIFSLASNMIYRETVLWTYKYY